MNFYQEDQRPAGAGFHQGAEAPSRPGLAGFKIIESGGWDKLQAQGIAHVLPLRKTGGLSQVDRRDFFRKTAASEQFLHEIGDIKLADGDIPVHVNAIGAAEYFGPNRKGDAFSEQVCRDRHHTFVTEGRNYVHHRNRDPYYSFGKIASSCYNDKMHRIELLVLSNGNDSAARRNGGYVLPDEFLSKLEKNAEVPVSMGCTIDHDVCNICGKRARTRAEYCDSGSCRDPKTGEYFPGCRNGLMKIASDGRMQFVYNIEPTFFDLSYVGVPADRTGYGFRADYLRPDGVKEASIAEPTAEDFLGIRPHNGWTMQYRSEMNTMLGKLAAFEQCCRDRAGEAVMGYGVRQVGQTDRLGRKLAAMLPETRMAALRYLAGHGVLLTPENFADTFSLGKTAVDEIRAGSGTIYADTLRRYRECRPDTPADFLAALDHGSDRKLAEMRLPLALVRESTFDPIKVAAAVMAGTIRFAGRPSMTRKTACFSRDLAESYALCNAATLCRFPADLREFGIKTAVWLAGVR